VSDQGSLMTSEQQEGLVQNTSRIRDVVGTTLMLGLPLALCAGPALAWSLKNGWWLVMIPASLMAGGAVVAWAGHVSAAFARRWAYITAVMCVVLVGLLHVVGELNFYDERSFDKLLFSVFLILALGLVVGAGLPIGVGIALGAGKGGWKERVVTVFSALSAYLLLGGLAYCVDRFELQRPSSHSDEAMIAHFNGHRGEFVGLVLLLEQDPSLHMAKISCPRPPSEQIDVSDDRRQRNRDRISPAGLGAISRCTSRDGSELVELSFWADAMYNSEKGFVYSPQPLSPTVDSLDHDRENGYAYRLIAKDWYLYRKPTT
jgi:hypothetical protein